VEATRRQFLIGTCGFVLAGCAEGVRQSTLPGMSWPDVAGRPRAGRELPAATDITASASAGTLLPRSAWTNTGPVSSRVNPMNGIRRITVHHEGMPYPIEFSDVPRTRSELEKVRRSHVDARGWGDIGYHYVIDRAGRIWEARSPRYQGAHVRDFNEHNIGVLVLGNFDLQEPSAIQLSVLERFVGDLRRRHGVSQNEIWTHQECPHAATACPGKSLQADMVRLRNRRAFA